MAWYPIGPSSYPDLFGQIQHVNSKRIADQFLSMKRDFDAMKIAAGSGDRLSPNEGRRTKERCELLWANFLRTGYPVAATLYTSRHYEETHGNAIDVGVTMANGQNRALTTAEFAWMHDQCQKRGFTWTGVSFGEPWHIEGDTRTEILPPYPDIIAGAAATPIEQTPVGDIVNSHIVHIDNRKGAYDSYLINPETMRTLHFESAAQENYWINKGVPLQDGIQPPQVITNFEKVGK